MPTVDITYDPSKPLSSPIILAFPSNGLRLRFDGPDQRLRLIEVLDFSKSHLTYEGKDIVKIPETTAVLGADPGIQGPSFRHIYDRLIGLAFPGEYVPPSDVSKNGSGTYILSYPGIAFLFPLQHSAWSPTSNFNTLLSSPAAGPASSMAIFSGKSWQEAAQDLYTKPYSTSRSLALQGRGKEQQPDTIELARICGKGRVDLIRRASPDFRIILGETTPQDLVAEMGPPDQIKRGRSDVNLDIYKRSPQDQLPDTTYDEPTSSQQTSAHTTADESNDEDQKGSSAVDPADDEPVECFYNYFCQGIDAFISPATGSSSSDELVVTKLLLHGNVPGSFQFKKYRRSRWVIELENTTTDSVMNSETPFEDLANSLEGVWHDRSQGESPYRRWFPVNRSRGWNSPGSSCELAGGWEEQADERRMGSVMEGAPGDGNAKMYGYPGTVFEVLRNDTVASVMVY